MNEAYISRINEAIFSVLNADWGLRADEKLGEMVFSAMGLDADGAPIPRGGKRIRPLLACLSCGALGGNVDRVLPAAAALEILHNFTLVHDDIEDQSDLRHGRPALWKKYGPALALNAGDYMISLCYRAVHSAARTTQLPIYVDLFDEMIKKVIFGQHLDISFEGRTQTTTEEYLGMISGKTVALLRGAMQSGAAAADCDERTMRRVREAGKKIGIAFQLQDDYLGIWGAADQLGKPVTSDIMTKKMTYPVLYGIEADPGFADLWNAYDGSAGRVAEIADRLAEAGAREATAKFVREESETALAVLRDALASVPDGAPAAADRSALFSLVERMITRVR